MAGRPLRNMMIDELEKRTEELFDGEEGSYTPFDYVTAWIENGRTLTALCYSISDVLNKGNELGPFQISRSMLTRYLDSISGESAVERLEKARLTGAHAMVESGLQTLDTSSDDRDSINAADKRLQARERLAALWNRAEFAQKAGLNIAVNIGQLHLDALRAPRAIASIASSLPALSAPTESITEYELQPTEQPNS